MQPQSYPLYVRAIRRDVTPSPTRTRAGVIIGWQPLPDLPDQDGPVVTWLAPIASPIAVPLSPEEWDWTITTDQPQPQEPDVPGHRPASRSEAAQTLSAGYSPIPGETLNTFEQTTGYRIHAITDTDGTIWWRTGAPPLFECTIGDRCMHIDELSVDQPDPTRSALAGLSVAQAYARGYQAGQHQLCPRCGVALETEVAAEQARRCGARGMAMGPGCIRHAGHEGGHGYSDGSGEQDSAAAGEKAAYGRGRDDEAAGLDIPEEYR
jgi:hypothetical protein